MRHRLKNKVWRVVEMAQWVMVLSTKPDALSLIPGLTLWKQNQLLQVVL